jgi:trk system potassium uptake protein TrkA
MEIAQNNTSLHFRIMAIKRGGRTILPRGDEVLRPEDQVFVLSFAEDVSLVSRLFTGSADRGIDHLMILGGGLVGARLAHTLSKGKKKIKLIEADRERARILSEELEHVLVLHGDPTDIDLLAAEGLAEMDALAAVTPQEESNLVACLMAKHLGVRKTVALLSKRAYIPISQAIGLDAAINVKLAVTAEVSRFLRGKHVLSVAAIHGVDTEILELLARDDSPITRKPISRLPIPRGALIGAVIGKESVRIATGSTVIQAGESAIIFSLPNITSKLEKLFDAH